METCGKGLQPFTISKSTFTLNITRTCVNPIYMKANYIEKNGYEILVAYPSVQGDDLSTLHTWEAGDPSTRQLYLCDNSRQAKNLIKSL